MKAWLIAGLLLLASPAWAEILAGKVVGIADGDTVTVLVPGEAGLRPTPPTTVKVRLWGIDAPEKKQAFGQKSKQRMTELVGGKEVKVDVRGRDRYGRTLGWILLDGKPVNLTLVQDGLAWWYRQYSPGAKDIANAEAQARSGRKGLWAEPDPQPPWEFRHPPK